MNTRKETSKNIYLELETMHYKRLNLCLKYQDRREVMQVTY